MTNRLSLRARLVLLTVSFATAVLLIGATVVISALRNYLIDRIDDQLKPVANIFALTPHLESDRTPNPDLRRTGMDFLGNPYVVELTPDGQPVRERFPTGQPTEDKPVLPALDTTTVRARGGEPFDVISPNGTTRWRAIALPRRTPPDSGGTTEGSILVATPRTTADDTISQLRTISLITGAGLLTLLALAGTLAVRVGLRPLRRIEDTAAAIAKGDLSHRVPHPATTRTEIGRLSRALNSMLVQLEKAFAARTASETTMRRFVADVSHELRTPLSGIKGFTELYRMGGLPERADVDRTMNHIEAEATRLSRLTEDLLLLARIDEANHHPTNTSGPTDLRTLAADARHDLHALDSSRPVTLTGPGGTGTPIPAQTLGDEARLRQVVVNLVGNVIAHTPPGSPVRIGVGTVNDQAILEIADTGPGLTPDQAARVFDRFYRVDNSRSRHANGGAGLGLAIVHSIVAAHNGHVELHTAPGKGATFRAVFPALTDDATHTATQAPGPDPV